MKITVTTSVRIERADGDSTNVTETVRDSCGDNPNFMPYEVCRVLTVANERVVDGLGGEEKARVGQARNVTHATNYVDRIYGPRSEPDVKADQPHPTLGVTCWWRGRPHVRELDSRDPDGCGWRTLHPFQPVMDESTV